MKKSLTKLLERSLDEAKRFEKGPATIELEKLLSRISNEVYGGKKFSWNQKNWSAWMELAKGELILNDHIVTLQTNEEGENLTEKFGIGGPESVSAPWSITCREDVTLEKQFYDSLEIEYELSEQNRHTPTFAEKNAATEAVENKGEGPYPNGFNTKKR